MKLNKRALLIIGSSMMLLIAGVFGLSSFDDTASGATPPDSETDRNKLSEAERTHFNIPITDYQLETGIIGRNEFLSNILQRYQIDLKTISSIAEMSKPVFDVRRISAGNPYTVFLTPEGKADYFVYQPNKIDYIVYGFKDGLSVHKGEKEVVSQVKMVAGTINSSLYQTLDDINVNPDMANKLAEIYGWAVNFYAIKKGDWFKIKYEHLEVDGEPVGSGKVLSAVFGHHGKEYEAYYFEAGDGEKGAYYDETGKSLRRAFLKAPIKYSRISSRFSPRRLHPVTKVWKAHLGTDFAAPTGTPIVATGDGIVVASTYAGGNGNYVKIQHDNVYATQYLHMSKRAVKRGDRVKQGQVIGYVGSTGLATGPHVCYRFWKNGKQVDALKQEFPSGEPIKEEHRLAFAQQVNTHRAQLAQLDPSNPGQQGPTIQDLFEFNLTKLLATNLEADGNEAVTEYVPTPVGLIRSL